MDDVLRDRLAQLAVGFGANVQPGQTLIVNAEVGRERVARAISDAAYRAGARHVEVAYTDAFVRRARIEHGSDESIGFAPDWQLERLRQMGDQHVALITLEAALDRAATEGLDVARLGADQSPVRQEYLKLVADRLINWCIVACPTPEWAEQVYPELDDGEALERLTGDLAHMLRLDAEDPVAAWSTRFDRLTEVAGRLTERRLEAVHFSGDGTDLTVGLLPSSRWLAAAFETAEGIPHRPNLPTEEIFTTPDPRRADGTVRSTKPLLVEGALIEGLRVRFEDGRAVEIDADSNGEVLRARAGRDDGASRLGELALVDGEGRIGVLDRVFYSTLIDENAASHIALGNALTQAVGDEADVSQANRSSIHIDFMIGSPEVDVDGISGGDRIPLLRRGQWQI
ncbi:MAG TPA: aminopeptidase [Gaiellales bacterium]